MDLQPVILAGGSGTRLWPLSREVYPKQFLSVSGELSLLQQSVVRLDGIETLADALVVCNEEHRFLTAEHIRQIGKTPKAIILESIGRNTAPALTLAALYIHDNERDPVLLVTPADHIIGDEDTFRFLVQMGATLAQQGVVVTFGISPNSPETGYGYIKKGNRIDMREYDSDATDTKHDDVEVSPYTIAAFVEKPDLRLAGEMLESGDFLWNSGIFMMKASVWLTQMERFQPDMAEICRRAHIEGKKDGDFFRPNPNVFAECSSDSIDYAVMEHIVGGSIPYDTDQHTFESKYLPLSSNCIVLPMNAGWSDVGSWSVIWEKGEPDVDGNVSQGDVYLESTKDSLLLAEHRLIAAVGLDGVIVVETPDAVLVANSDYVQDVKALVQKLKDAGRGEQKNHRKVHRPWGSYETVDSSERFQVKRLTVNPGEALSLQRHQHRAEHWVVVEGTAKVTRNDEQFMLKEDESIYVPLGATHRLENPGEVPLNIIEVQSGGYLGEDDIERFDDRYNRHNQT